MTCPACGGTARRAVTPNLFTCTSVVYGRVATGVPHPALGPQWQDVPATCGVHYQDGAGVSGVACQICGLDSVGTCQHCDGRFCGIHGTIIRDRFLCPSAQQDQQRARDSEAADAQAKQRSAEAGQQAHSRAQEQFLERRHVERKRANILANPEQEALRRQIEQLEVRAVARDVPGNGALAGMLFASPFVVLVVGAMLAQGRTDVSPGPFVLLGFAAAYGLWALLRVRAERHNARRGAIPPQVAALRAKLGCGELSCSRCQRRPAST